MSTRVDSGFRGQVGARTAGVVGEVVALSRKGTNKAELWGLCPFHDEKTPSFSVNVESGLWHCFGCDRGGDGFDWLMLERGLSFPQAAEAWLEILGSPRWSAGPRMSAPGRPGVRPKADSDGRSAHDRYDVVFQEVWSTISKPWGLCDSSRAYLGHRAVDPDFAYDYGIRSVSIVEWSAAEDVLVGWTAKHREVSGLFEDGRFSPPKGDVNIVFPVFVDAADGGPRRVRFRAPRDGATVLQVRGGSLAYPFNAKALGAATGEVWVGEGELDVLPLIQGGHVAVAIPGATAKGPSEWVVGRLEHVGTVHAAFDADDAGDTASERLREQIQRRWGSGWFTPGRLVRSRPKAGKDLNDLAMKGGRR